MQCQFHDSVPWNIDSTHAGRARVIPSLPSKSTHVWGGDFDSFTIDTDIVLIVVFGFSSLNLSLLLTDVNSDISRKVVPEEDIAIGIEALSRGDEFLE